MLVADASGFSRLAEAAADDPLRGAESVAELLQRRFEPIVRRCEEHGGLIVCFPGDAVLVFFPCTSKTDRPEVRATAAARELLEDAGSLEGPKLRCTVSWGPLHVVSLGTSTERRHDLVAGPPVSRAFELQSDVAASEVLVRPPAGTMLGDDDVALTNSFRDEGLASTFSFAQGAALRALVDDRSGLVAEQRLVTTLFVRIDGSDPADDRGVEAREDDYVALTDAFASVEETIGSHQGALVQSLFDEGGLTIMACWGLPGSTFEDDVPRALAGATEIERQVTRHGLRCSLGIATGKVFTGPRGARHRFEYAPIGHSVNLAARLMQLGERGVRVDDATASQAGPRWKLVESSLRQLPKLDRPFRVHSLAAIDAAPIANPDMFGRLFERAQIEDAIVAIGIRPNAPRLGYEAAPGMGKSMLARYARERLSAREVRVISIVGRERGSDAPEISLASLFSHASADIAGDLTEMLAHEPRLLDWIPAFLSVLDPRVRDSELSRRMEPEQRRHAARRIFASLLDSFCARQPCAVLVDDAHGLDEATEDLVLHALRTVPALGAFFFGRAEESGRGPWTSRAPKVGLVIRPLAGLDDESVGALVASVVGTDRATPEVVRNIARRCDGNPLFVRHIALAMQDVPTSEADGSKRAIARTLPPTIEATISARIDRLPVPARHTLKLASVLGREFDESTLASMDQDSAAHIEHLGERGILVRDARTKRARFEHAMTREVAYDLLLDSQRRELHGRAAKLLVDAESAAATRAYHRVRSDAPWEAIDDLDELGREATRRFANFEALAYLEQADALESLHRSRMSLDPDSARLRATRRAALMAEAAHKIGRHETAMAVGRRAGAFVGIEFPDDAIGKVASVARSLATHVRSRRFGLSGREGSVPAVDASLHRAAASACYWASLSAFNHNHVGSYVLFNVLTLNLTDRIAPVRERALAMAVMGITAGLVRAHGVAERYGRDAIALTAELGDELAGAHVRMFDAIRLGALGRFDALERSCTPVIPVADRFGDLRLAAELRSLCALGAQFRGSLDVAEALWHDVLSLSKESSDPTVENWARCGLVEVELRHRRPPRLRFCEDQLAAARLAAANLGAEESVRGVGLDAWLAGVARPKPEALASIGRALDALDALDAPNAFWSLDGMSGPYLGLRALRDRGEIDLGSPEVRVLVSRAASTIGRYARVFALGDARRSLAWALEAEARGFDTIARLATNAAGRAAERLGLAMELEQIRLRSPSS